MNRLDPSPEEIKAFLNQNNVGVFEARKTVLRMNARAALAANKGSIAPSLYDVLDLLVEGEL